MQIFGLGKSKNKREDSIFSDNLSTSEEAKEEEYLSRPIINRKSFFAKNFPHPTLLQRTLRKASTIKRIISFLLQILQVLVLIYLTWLVKDLTVKLNENLNNKTVPIENKSTKNVSKNVKAGVFEIITDEKGNRYDTLIVNLQQNTIELFFKDKQNNRIGNFSQLQKNLQKDGRELVFAMNAGIFGTDWKPLGLHIEKGQLLKPLNLNAQNAKSLDGITGNFYLIPNGVFYIQNNKASIAETTFFDSNIKTNQITLATQSGPILLLDGVIHPKFEKNSENQKIRNGVGIIDENRVVFVISKDRVSFYDFASTFRDKLGCKNALYLDGTISQMYIPEINEEINNENFAGMVAVTVSSPNPNMR